MDETDIKRILAPYCPPLGYSQLECITAKIVELSKSESKDLASKVAARRRIKSSKSRSRE
jgi:GTP-sensing pleiotropic transcriptional regulator CodY